MPKGTKTFSQLAPSTDLAAANVGFMWNISDAFTTTADFVEGAGVSIPAGANVYVANPSTGVYKYDIFQGMYDLSGYALKSEMSVTPGEGANADKTTIQLKTGTSATVLTTHQDISGKADKLGAAFSATSTYAVGAKVLQGGKIYECTTAVETAGEWDTVKSNFKEITDEILILGGDGAYKPSGKKTSDFATAAQGAKADSAVQSVAEGSTNGTVAVDGSDVAVHGLGSAAYAATSDFQANVGIAADSDIDEIFPSA